MLNSEQETNISSNHLSVSFSFNMQGIATELPLAANLAIETTQKHTHTHNKMGNRENIIIDKDFNSVLDP